MNKNNNPAVSHSSLKSSQLGLPAISGRNWSVHFDEPELTSDAGLAAVRASGVGDQLVEQISGVIHDGRKSPDHHMHQLIGQRIYQIVAGYYDADDCDHQRNDVVLQSVAGRDSDKGPLASQPTMSRLENSVRRTDLMRIAQAIFQHYLDGKGDSPPEMICIDMDPSAHLTYGQQQLSLFNTHVGDYCLMPFYIFDGCTGEIMTAVLRPGKTPTAGEIIVVLKRLVAGIRERWPEIRIVFRADSHHTKPQVLDWLYENKVDFVTGLQKNKVLERLFAEEIEQAQREYQHNLEAKERGEFTGKDPGVTVFADGYYAAGSWSKEERVVARIIVGERGVDVRYIVSSFEKADAQYIYETVYCQRGNAELFIKECKLGLGSDRSSCTRWESNQFRLLLHVAAYVILHRFRSQVLAGTKWERATFDEIRLRIIKVGGRLEVLKTKVKLHLASALEPVLRGVWHTAAAVGAGTG